MKISSEKLTGLIVETQSGQKVGKVEGFNVDTESQSILEYVVKPSNLVAGLIKGELVVARGQVVDITDKKIVVDDNLVKGGLKKRSKKVIKERVAQGAMMKEKIH